MSRLHPPCRLCGSHDDPRFHPDRCPRFGIRRRHLTAVPDLPTAPCEPVDAPEAAGIVGDVGGGFRLR